MTSDFLLGLVFPQKCPLCGKLLEPESSYGPCADCLKSVVRTEEPHCVVCGLPPRLCVCESFDRAFARRRAPFVYSGSVRNGIHRMKFYSKPSVAKYFGGEMAEYVKSEYREYKIDIVVCVPMRHIDTVKRGYNQAALLAVEIAKKLELDCDIRALRKIRITQKQHELDSCERAYNLRGAFLAASHADLAGKTVLLCDDVATTGHTLNECSRALLDAGARQVLCICAAAVC